MALSAIGKAKTYLAATFITGAAWVGMALYVFMAGTHNPSVSMVGYVLPFVAITSMAFYGLWIKEGAYPWANSPREQSSGSMPSS